MAEHTTVRRSMTEAARDQSTIYSSASNPRDVGRATLIDLVAKSHASPSSGPAPRPKTNHDLEREQEDRAPDESKRRLLRGGLIAAGAGAVGVVVGKYAGGAPSDSLRIRDDYIQFKGLTAHPSPPPEGGEWYIASVNKWFGSPDGVNVVPLVGSHGVSTGGNTLGDTGVSPGRVVFYGGNNVTLSQLTDVSGSKTVLIQAAAGGGGGVALSAGTQSGSTGTMVLADSNGLVFGMSASSQVTGSYTTAIAGAAIQDVGSVTGSGTATSRFAAEDHAHRGLVSAGVSTSGNTSGDTTVAPGYLVLEGGNSITLSQITGASGAKTVRVSGPTIPPETPFAASAGTQSVSTGTVVYSNSNNVTFGMSGSSIITASASFPPETPFAVSAGTQSVSTGTVAFSNSNNVSFGMSGSNTITASASYSQSTAPAAISAGTQQATSGTIKFADSNGISFGMSNSSQITASYTVPTQTPFGISAGTQSVSTGTVIFSNSNNVTFGMSGSNTVTASASFAETQTFLGALAAGTQTATSGTVKFADSNGLTFGMSASTQVTGSYSVPVVSNAIQNVNSATNSGTNTSRFAADDHAHLGIVSVGVSTGGNTSGDTTVAPGYLVLQGGNSITLSQITAAGGAKTVVISGPSGAGETPFGISAGTQSISTGTVVFANSNNITFGMSGSSQVTASFSETKVFVGGLAAGTQTATSGTVAFVDSNGMTFGMSASTRITASYTVPAVPVVSNALQDVSTATGSGTNTSRFAADDHVHRGVRALIASGTAASFYGNVVVDSGALISLATGGASTAGSIQIINLWSSATTASRVDSANAVGAMASRAALEGHQHAGLWAIDVGGNTGKAGNTSSGAGSFQLAGGGNVQLSGATAAGGETLSIVAGGTMSRWFDPIMAGSYTVGQLGAQTSVILPLHIPEPLQIDRLLHWISFSLSSSTNSSHAGNVSFWAGIYTRSGSSLSLGTSGSQTYQWTNTSNNSSQSLQGFRMLSIPMSATLTPGDYWLGFVSRTSSTNANWFTMSNVMVSRFNTVYSGSFLSATNASMQKILGSGSFSAATSGVQATIAFSDIRDAGAALWGSSPVMMLASSTV